MHIIGRVGTASDRTTTVRSALFTTVITILGALEQLTEVSTYLILATLAARSIELA